MAVRIRLARCHLTRNSPSYTLVATSSTSRPTAKPLETLGSYSPLPVITAPVSLSPNGAPRATAEWGPGYFKPRKAHGEVGEKKVEWNEERLRYWLSIGAKPSKTVERLLNQAGIIQSNPIPLRTSGETGGTGGKKLVISRDRRIREAVRTAEKERGEVPVAQR